MSGWHTEQMVGFDIESTGVDVEADRVVTAAIVQVIPGGSPPVRTTGWLIDPGTPIPEGATKIHGITTEMAATQGLDPAHALSEISGYLAQVLSTGTPLVLSNAVYDLTLLDRDCRRHGLYTLTQQLLPFGVEPIIDVLVLDRYLVPRRSGKGARKLDALCRHYNATLDGAHDAAFDALAAVRIAWRMAHCNPGLAAMDLTQLHELQMVEKKRQDAEMARWLRGKGSDASDCDGQWPIRELA